MAKSNIIDTSGLSKSGSLIPKADVLLKGASQSLHWRVWSCNSMRNIFSQTERLKGTVSTRRFNLRGRLIEEQMAKKMLLNLWCSYNLPQTCPVCSNLASQTAVSMETESVCEHLSDPKFLPFRGESCFKHWKSRSQRVRRWFSKRVWKKSRFFKLNWSVN